MKCTLSFVNVQHGDCIVINVEQPQGVFSILIDGGKTKYRAVDKLFNQNLLPKSNGKAQIDLMIASHHDMDHIGGLIDVVNDSRFEIKQAWVPVVLKPNFDPWIDVQDETFTEAAIRNPDQALSNALASMESGLNHSVEADSQEGLAVHGTRFLRPATIHVDAPRGIPGFSLEEFDSHAEEFIDLEALSNHPTILRLVNAGLRIPGGIGCGYKALPHSHYDERHLQFWADEDDLESRRSMSETFKEFNNLERSADGIIFRPRRIENFLMALAATTTRTYYNVTLVANLIKALRERNIPIYMPLASKTGTVLIDPSTSARVPENNIGLFHIELLSPTKELVQRYQKKLIMPPDMLALARGINYVTVPNKMSYVFNLKVDKATALLTGDSGFTDFYFGSKRVFDEDRVKKIKDVGFVKVPHHGGHFERFARCYQYLLDQDLSIKTQFFVTSLGAGHINPSEEFEHLANVILSKQDFAPSPKFQFTNPPTRTRFDLVCQSCPRENSFGGDVLSYEADDLGDWRLTSIDSCCSALQPKPHALRFSEAALDIQDVVREGLFRRRRQ